MMVNGSKTVRAYCTPGVSKVAVVGSNPFSSAVIPKVSFPPFFGLAVEMPLACLPLGLEPPEFDWLCAAEARPVSIPPVAPAMVSPAAAAVPRARNERRSIGFDMVPLLPTAGDDRAPTLSGAPPTPATRRDITAT